MPSYGCARRRREREAGVATTRREMAGTRRPGQQSQSRRATSTATAARRKAVGLYGSPFHLARACLGARACGTGPSQVHCFNELASLFVQEFQCPAHVADAHLALQDSISLPAPAFLRITAVF